MNSMRELIVHGVDCAARLREDENLSMSAEDRAAVLTCLRAVLLLPGVLRQFLEYVRVRFPSEYAEDYRRLSAEQAKRDAHRYQDTWSSEAIGFVHDIHAGLYVLTECQIRALIQKPFYCQEVAEYLRSMHGSRGYWTDLKNRADAAIRCDCRVEELLKVLREERNDMF